MFRVFDAGVSQWAGYAKMWKSDTSERILSRFTEPYYNPLCGSKSLIFIFFGGIFHGEQRFIGWNILVSVTKGTHLDYFEIKGENPLM